MGALLILLSLFLGSGTAAAGAGDFRDSVARPGPARHSAAALLPSATRNPLDDESPGTEGDSSAPPAAPAVLTRRLWARPLDDALPAGQVLLPRARAASYRARAPPAA